MTKRVMTKSIWGEDRDKEACSQLKLSDDYGIIFASTSVELFHDEIFREEVEDSYIGADEAIGMIQRASSRIDLPVGLMAVGMCKFGTDGPLHYGVIRTEN